MNVRLPDIAVLWIEGPLSRLEELSLVSMIRCGHAVRLFTYDPTLVAPAGVSLVDASEIIPKTQLFRNNTAIGKGSWGPFSDLFRFTLLHQYGGVWSDLDVVFLKPIDFLSEQVTFASERTASPGTNGVNMAGVPTTCFIHAPKADPVIAFCLEQTLAIGRTQKSWGESGPGVVQQAINKPGQAAYILNPDVFCSIPHWEVHKLVTGFHPTNPSAYGLHFWNEVWRWNFMDKNMAYDALSIYERLKQHYLKPVNSNFNESLA